MTTSTLTRAAAATLALAAFGCAQKNDSAAANAVSATSIAPSTEPAVLATTGPSLAAFATPEAAVAALAEASRSQAPAALNAILGPGAEDVVYSGDPVADQKARQWFVQTFDTYHGLAKNDDGTVTLEMGQSHWPMPIPIEQNKATGQWGFDVPAGRDEILNRRIGRDELACIQVCHAIVDAQQEYAMADADHDGVPAYAQRFVSHQGKKDGLYWPVEGEEKLSPLGSLFATAADDGYSATQAIGPRQPYHGYYFRMLKTQGPGATGGERDYRVNGPMIGGFGVVAWPADYGNSGIMTFIVNQEGVVYQRNLGEQTTEIAKAMTAYDPAPPWSRCEPDPATTQFSPPR